MARVNPLGLSIPIAKSDSPGLAYFPTADFAAAEDGSISVKAEGITQTQFDSNYVDAKFHDSPISVQIDGTAASGVDTEVNILNVGDGIMFEQYNMGTQTIIVPIMETAGLEIGLDKTENDGVQYDLGITSRSRCVYTARTDACFVECTVALADASGVDPFYIGFRKQAARNSTLGSYTDYFVLGVEGTANPNKIQFQTNLNNAGAATTDSTDTWADAASKTIRVNVSAAGVATGLIDGASPTTEPAAFTFDDGDVLMPFIYLLHGATSPGKINITSFKCGLQ